MLTYKDFNAEYPEIDISEGIFYSLNRRIRTRIDFLTFERIKDDDEKLQKRIDNVVCDIICELYFSDIGIKKEKEGNSLSNIKSESVGEYRVEYGGKNELDTDKKINLQDRLIEDRIREAFIHTGLMFRGYYENERKRNNY